MIKLTAIVKSPEEILGPGAKGVIGFSTEEIDYVPEMCQLVGTRIALEHLPISEYGTYSGENFHWLKEWLRDFEEEVDWSKVPVDTKVIAGHGVRGYFAKYQDGKVYIWDNGRTSFTADTQCSWWGDVSLYREDDHD